MYAYRDGKPIARFDQDTTRRVASTNPNLSEVSELGTTSWVELYHLDGDLYALLQYYFCDERGFWPDDRATVIDKPDAIAWALENGCELPTEWEEKLGIIVVGKKDGGNTVRLAICPSRFAEMKIYRCINSIILNSEESGKCRWGSIQRCD